MWVKRGLWTHFRDGFQAHACCVHSCWAGITAKQVTTFTAHSAGSCMAVLTPLLSIHQIAEFLLDSNFVNGCCGSNDAHPKRGSKLM